nr:hypothetical protein [Tanacetum cinerariifolium]
MFAVSFAYTCMMYMCDPVASLTKADLWYMHHSENRIGVVSSDQATDFILLLQDRLEIKMRLDWWNGAHYGYNCPPKVPIIPNPKPFNNQTIKELPPTVQNVDPKSDLVYDYPNGMSILTLFPEKESDEFIKSSVENLIPNPSESEGEHECDVPVCEGFTTFSNILFDADYDFYSTDDQSFSDEDVPNKIFPNPLFDEEIISMKIDPHHFNAESELIDLLNHDSSIISSSSKIDFLFDEFTSELTFSNQFQEFNSENSDAIIESFSPSPIPVEDSDSLMEEIDLSFTPDYPMPLGIEEDDYDSEKDILILEELLSNNFLSLPKN